MVAAAGSGQQIGPLKMLTTRAGVHQSRMTELFEGLRTAEERSSRMQLPLPARDLGYVMVRINIVHLRRLRLERVRSARRTALPRGEQPLAWPLLAAVDDLAGLPSHVISVNELDLLRRQGPTRTLTGVSQARHQAGCCHQPVRRTPGWAAHRSCRASLAIALG